MVLFLNINFDVFFNFSFNLFGFFFLPFAFARLPGNNIIIKFNNFRKVRHSEGNKPTSIIYC